LFSPTGTLIDFLKQDNLVEFSSIDSLPIGFLDTLKKIRREEFIICDTSVIEDFGNHGFGPRSKCERMLIFGLRKNESFVLVLRKSVGLAEDIYLFNADEKIGRYNFTSLWHLNSKDDLLIRAERGQLDENWYFIGTGEVSE